MFTLFSFSAIIFALNHSGSSCSNELGETSLSASIDQLRTRHPNLLVETDQGDFAGAGSVNPRRHWPGRAAGLLAGGRTGSAAAPTAAGR